MLFVWMENPGMIPAGVILCCLALCLHSVSHKDNPSVRIAQVCGWFFVCLGISIVLCGALMLCCTAVFELLIQNVPWRVASIISSCIPYVSFLLFAPWLFLGGLPKEDTPIDKRVGFRKFTYVVLLPLYLLLLSILLAYVVKIAVTFTMPVGVMNSYGIAALTLFVFFHLMLTGEENKLSKWFKKWGGLLLVPIVAVQGIGVWMRVSAYGLTEARVLGIVWTALCIAVVITSLFRKRASWFFLAAGAVSVIIFCTPISAQNMAIMNQESRLRTALTESNMFDAQGDIIPNSEASVENQEIIYSAADYLYHETARKGSLTEQLQLHIDAIRSADESKENSVSLSEAKRLLFGFGRPEKVDTDWYGHYYYFNGTAVREKLDTRGYSYAEWISIYNYEGTDEDAAKQNLVEIETLEPVRYGTTDVAAFIDLLEANRSTNSPLQIDIPVTFMIDGEEIDLASLLNGTQFADGNADLITDTLILPSGKKLHLSRVNVANYSGESSNDYIFISGWLLTPDE